MSTERIVCPRCAIKHLSQARALLLETRKGYPTHVAFAMGHMAEAEDEIVLQMPESASLIREERLKLEADPEYVPNWERLITIVAIDGMLPGTEGL